MRPIDTLRKRIAPDLSLSKDLVKDVLAFTYKELLASFKKGDVIEWSGLGTFTVNERKRLLQVENTKKDIQFVENLLLSIEDPTYKEIKEADLLSHKEDLKLLANAKKRPLKKNNRAGEGSMVQPTHQSPNEQTSSGGSEDHQGEEGDMWPVPLQL